MDFLIKHISESEYRNRITITGFSLNRCGLVPNDPGTSSDLGTSNTEQTARNMEINCAFVLLFLVVLKSPPAKGLTGDK